MAHQLIIPVFAFLWLISTAEALTFDNAYIQNVRSGQCVTIGRDAKANPLSTTKCKCHHYQFWAMEGVDKIRSVVARRGYMDELYGYPENGKPIGVSDLNGNAWQKWNVNERSNGIYSFIVKHNSKCMQQGKGVSVVQWDCDDNNPSQQWKIIENPCGTLPKVPTDRFQLQNPKTGKCAVVEGGSNAYYAKVVTHSCICDKKHHYWKFDKKMLKSAGSGQCMANWETWGYPGPTQQKCYYAGEYVDELALGISALEDGSFLMVNGFCGQCVRVDYDAEDAPLRFARCDRKQDEQKWKFHDACK